MSIFIYGGIRKYSMNLFNTILSQEENLLDKPISNLNSNPKKRSKKKMSRSKSR